MLISSHAQLFRINSLEMMMNLKFGLPLTPSTSRLVRWPAITSATVSQESELPIFGKPGPRLNYKFAKLIFEMASVALYVLYPRVFLTRF